MATFYIEMFSDGKLDMTVEGRWIKNISLNISVSKESSMLF